MSRENKGGSRWRKAVCVLLIAVLLPAVLYLGQRYGRDRYYLMSAAVLIIAMLPFFLMFEQRRPQPRELVMLAVMSALAAASRAAFIWLPGFKPMMGIVIIAGVAFGAQFGFLTGTLSVLVSNFLFSQGPWTPWQMFAFGMGGLLAGLLGRMGAFSGRRVPVGIALCLYGAPAVLLVAGPILDTYSVLSMLSRITPEGVAAVFLAGLGSNVTHAVATVATLLLFGKPMLEKLRRVQRKYGMMEG